MPTSLTTVRQALSGPASVVVRSPGRVNLIGEHTDYSGGLVLPAAIDRCIYFSVRPIPGKKWHVKALDINQSANLSLPVDQPVKEQWLNYLAGVGKEFQLLGYDLPGLEIALGGDLPHGAGVSSSAALEGGMAFVLNEVLGAGLSRSELALLCQRSSNNFMGVPTGIMDQFASLNGNADGPILLNCDTLEYRPIANRLAGYSFLLVNSMITHDLANSEYPQRVTSCNAARRAVQERYSGIKHLGDVTPQQLLSVSGALDPVTMQRARYVIAENQRVKEMVDALATGDATAAIDLLNATHAGLRDDYEVSCPEVDFLQHQATAHFTGSQVGARIMGGGFGGCTINLVRQTEINALANFLTQSYRNQFGISAEVMEVRFAEGTGLEEP